MSPYNVVHDGPEGVVHSRVGVPWKPVQSVGVDGNLFGCPTSREEEDMRMDEPEPILGADVGVPKVLKVNIAQTLSYCLSIATFLHQRICETS